MNRVHLAELAVGAAIGAATGWLARRSPTGRPWRLAVAVVLATVAQATIDAVPRWVPAAAAGAAVLAAWLVGMASRSTGPRPTDDPARTVDAPGTTGAAGAGERHRSSAGRDRRVGGDDGAHGRPVDTVIVVTALAADALVYLSVPDTEGAVVLGGTLGALLVGDLVRFAPGAGGLGRRGARSDAAAGAPDPAHPTAVAAGLAATIVAVAATAVGGAAGGATPAGWWVAKVVIVVGATTAVGALVTSGRARRSR